MSASSTIALARPTVLVDSASNFGRTAMPVVLREIFEDRLGEFFVLGRIDNHFRAAGGPAAGEGKENDRGESQSHTSDQTGAGTAK